MRKKTTRQPRVRVTGNVTEVDTSKGASVYEIVTQGILDRLEAGVVPWREPWSAYSWPVNFDSGKRYSGINVWILQAGGYDCSVWLTFKQAQNNGLSVQKGSKGTRICYYNCGKYEDSEGNEKRSMVLRYYTVFNLRQCIGITDSEITDLEADIHGRPVSYEHTPIELADALVAGMPLPPTMSNGGDRAYYRPSTDHVQMPERTAFESPESYYSVLFHELGHSTGANIRLGRFGADGATASFGSADYSQEELVAEFCASYLCAESGISPAVIDQQAAYIDGWSRVLRKNPKMLLAGASQGQKAAEYIQGKDRAEASE